MHCHKTSLYFDIYTHTYIGNDGKGARWKIKHAPLVGFFFFFVIGISKLKLSRNLLLSGWDRHTHDQVSHLSSISEFR